MTIVDSALKAKHSNISKKNEWRIEAGYPHTSNRKVRYLDGSNLRIFSTIKNTNRCWQRIQRLQIFRMHKRSCSQHDDGEILQTLRYKYETVKRVVKHGCKLSTTRCFRCQCWVENDEALAVCRQSNMFTVAS